MMQQIDRLSSSMSKYQHAPINSVANCSGWMVSQMCSPLLSCNASNAHCSTCKPIGTWSQYSKRAVIKRANAYMHYMRSGVQDMLLGKLNVGPLS